MAYLSFRLSPSGAGLTDILGWVEMELCDWLLAKDEVSRLTGDMGGVGLLHSEWEREPGDAMEENGHQNKTITLVQMNTFIQNHPSKIL